MTSERTRVLIVDDSKAMCHFLTGILSSDHSIDVVGHALDPYEARDMIKTLRPDVLTLDIEMPRMDGITFLSNLMRLKPMPVVMLSSLTAAGAAVTLKALSLGAVDFLVKRHPGGEAELQEYAASIISVVKNASKAKIGKTETQGSSPSKDPNYPCWKRKVGRGHPINTKLSRVIAIGASTGGPEAIAEVLQNLSAPTSAVVLSQHMPKNFMAPFAERLNSLSSFSFAEARHGEPLLPGHGYVAPGDRHLKFKRFADDVLMDISDDPKCNGHRPAVDIMYDSLAKVCGSATLGVILTGMGNDGAQGMKNLHNAGALTFAQDERSSAVWGMPGCAVRAGGVDGTLSLREIGPTVEALLR